MKTNIVAILLACLMTGASLNVKAFNTSNNWLDDASELYQKITSVSFTSVQMQEADATASDVAVAVEELIIYAPNYDKNFKIFLVLTTIGVFLLIAIFMTISSAKNITSSEYFKSRLIEKYRKIREANTPKLILVALMAGGVGNLFAASGEPWLKLSNTDLYWLMGLDLALFFTYLYVRSYVRNLLDEIKTEEELALVAQLSKKSSMAYILTKQVEIEEEHTIMMDHEYDGIRELDNDLPPWWKWGFYATILWSVVYLFHYHIIGTGDLQAIEYEKSIAKAEMEISAYLKKAALNVDEKTATVLTDSKDLAKGAAIYKQYCVSCHGQQGEGDIGPNLTDDYWIYGNDIKEVFYTIKHGAKNGMKSWKDELNPLEMQQLASFILHLEPVEGKGPEGEQKERKALNAGQEEISTQ
ncbi:MAG: cbb3-type cytochrome c oxidase N-terminal domain-containing protein [Flavobacteriales bacterium]